MGAPGERIGGYAEAEGSYHGQQAVRSSSDSVPASSTSTGQHVKQGAKALAAQAKKWSCGSSVFTAVSNTKSEWAREMQYSIDTGLLSLADVLGDGVSEANKVAMAEGAQGRIDASRLLDMDESKVRASLKGVREKFRFYGRRLESDRLQWLADRIIAAGGDAQQPLKGAGGGGKKKPQKQQALLAQPYAVVALLLHLSYRPLDTAPLITSTTHDDRETEDDDPASVGTASSEYLRSVMAGARPKPVTQDGPAEPLEPQEALVRAMDDLWRQELRMDSTDEEDVDADTDMDTADETAPQEEQTTGAGAVAGTSARHSVTARAGIMPAPVTWPPAPPYGVDFLSRPPVALSTHHATSVSSHEGGSTHSRTTRNPRLLMARYAEHLVNSGATCGVTPRFLLLQESEAVLSFLNALCSLSSSLFTHAPITPTLHVPSTFTLAAPTGARVTCTHMTPSALQAVLRRCLCHINIVAYLREFIRRVRCRDSPLGELGNQRGMVVEALGEAVQRWLHTLESKVSARERDLYAAMRGEGSGSDCAKHTLIQTLAGMRQRFVEARAIAEAIRLAVEGAEGRRSEQEERGEHVGEQTRLRVATGRLLSRLHDTAMAENAITFTRHSECDTHHPQHDETDTNATYANKKRSPPGGADAGTSHLIWDLFTWCLEPYWRTLEEWVETGRTTGDPRGEFCVAGQGRDAIVIDDAVPTFVRDAEGLLTGRGSSGGLAAMGEVGDVMRSLKAWDAKRRCSFKAAPGDIVVAAAGSTSPRRLALRRTSFSCTTTADPTTSLRASLTALAHRCRHIRARCASAFLSPTSLHLPLYLHALHLLYLGGRLGPLDAFVRKLFMCLRRGKRPASDVATSAARASVRACVAAAAGGGCGGGSDGGSRRYRDGEGVHGACEEGVEEMEGGMRTGEHDDELTTDDVVSRAFLRPFPAADAASAAAPDGFTHGDTHTDGDNQREAVDLLYVKWAVAPSSHGAVVDTQTPRTESGEESDGTGLTSPSPAPPSPLVILEGLDVLWKVPWPLSCVLKPEHIALYSKMQALPLMARFVRERGEELWRDRKMRMGAARHLQTRIMSAYFIAMATEEYLAAAVMGDGLQSLIREMRCASDIGELCSLHERHVRELEAAMLLQPDTRPLRVSLIVLLTRALEVLDAYEAGQDAVVRSAHAAMETEVRMLNGLLHHLVTSRIAPFVEGLSLRLNFSGYFDRGGRLDGRRCG